MNKRPEGYRWKSRNKEFFIMLHSRDKVNVKELHNHLNSLFNLLFSILILIYRLYWVFTSKINFLLFYEFLIYFKVFFPKNRSICFSKVTHILVLLWIFNRNEKLIKKNNNIFQLLYLIKKKKLIEDNDAALFISIDLVRILLRKNLLFFFSIFHFLL